MAEIKLICPDCGGAIQHQCGANSGAIAMNALAQNPAQISAQNGEIAQDSKIYNQGYDPNFLVFWSIYPLKRDKRKAQIAWRKSVKRLGANRAEAMAQILAGAARYRDDPNREDQFTKYAEGWLNGDGWEDEPLPSRQPSLADWATRNLQPPAPKPMHEEDYRRILEEGR